MKCLEKGHNTAYIVKSFESDNQLVRMWISFLEHNHWMQRLPSNGEWTITDKGRGKMKQYDGERDSSF
jgi:hypothetical protein